MVSAVRGVLGNSSLRLAGKVALITGSSRGIGRAIALTFAGEGADVIINYSSDKKGATETFEKVRAVGRRAIMKRADVSSKSEVDAMVSDALSEFGRIDILANNAGIVSRESIQDFKEDAWTKAIDVNLNGTLNCTRAVSVSMISNRSGKIINTSSIGGLVVRIQSGLGYTVSKAGIIALTKRLAIDLGPFGINVNAVAPGLIMTDMLYAGRNKETVENQIQERIRLTALGRFGRPEDVANAFLFLASEESSFITGQVLVVDGGRLDFFSHS